ncbi:MAG: ShlB/FhaC/HecB family hemolysin secretion/activation protein [Nitrospinales bacterium]
MKIKPKHIKLQGNNFLLVFAGLIIAIFACNSAFAQEALRLEPSGQPGDKRPPLIEEKSPGPPPSLELPPPLSPKEKVPGTLPLESVFIRKITVTGGTVFSEQDLAEITALYENRKLTNEDLEELRRNLTLLYIHKGYITSGAIIPDQTVYDGEINLQIIEGRLQNIKIEKNKYLRDSFYKKRIVLDAGPPVKIENLQQRLRILQEDPRIRRLNAELKPGVKLGENDLNLTVDEKIPLTFWSGYNNYISDSVGGDQILVTGAHLSLTGNGDILSFTWGDAEGMKPKIDAYYLLPLSARDLTLSLRYRKNDFDLVREQFRDLNIETDTDIYSIVLRYPIYRSLNQEFALSLIGEHEKQKTTLLDHPFSFEPGAVDGEVNVTPLRFAQEWTYRAQNQVIAARSRFSLGTNAFDATTRESGIPDSKFFAWQGQFQWVRRFKPLDTQLIFRNYLQFSADPLVSLEQFTVGGRYTVRGYPENFFVRDNGAVASLEARISLIRDKPWADYIQVVPFFDWGWAENTDFPTPPGPRTIYSIGVGMRWAVTFSPPIRLRPEFEIYWGYRLRDFDIDVENNLQDQGISLQFVIASF